MIFIERFFVTDTNVGGGNDACLDAASRETRPDVVGSCGFALGASDANDNHFFGRGAVYQCG